MWACYSIPGVMDAFVEHWVRPTVHSTSGSVSPSVINEGGDERPGCILITHKDKERYGEEDRERRWETKERERNRLYIDIIICGSLQILHWTWIHRETNIKKIQRGPYGVRFSKARSAGWADTGPSKCIYRNTHRASQSRLFMLLNILTLQIQLVNCAVIVDIAGINYANFKVSWSL